MDKFTPTQARYLSFIHAFTTSVGCPPSMQDIADALEVRTPSVNGMLKKLDEKRLIKRQPGVPRSIELVVDPETLPKWDKPIVVQGIIRGRGRRNVPQRGRRRSTNISRAVVASIIDRMLKQEPEKAAAGQSVLDECVFQFKITLNNMDPKIWRRIQIPDTDLVSFNYWIQDAMGWSDSHGWQFLAGGKYYLPGSVLEVIGIDSGTLPADETLISDLVRDLGAKLKIRYDYDFGDDWQHEVKLEKVFRNVEASDQRPRCTDGENACPPEDCGGIWGYLELLEALDDPEDERHQEMMEWMGPIDYYAFDADEATKRMQDGWELENNIECAAEDFE